MNSARQNPFPAPASINGYQTISGGCSESTQLRLPTGNMIVTVAVANVSTSGLPLVLSLVYNAQGTISDVLGHKWRHNYMANLVFNGDPLTSVIFEAESGRSYQFVPDGQGGWKAGDQSYFFTGQLSQLNPDWQVAFPDGTTYVFNPSGRLVQHLDRHGNAMQLYYNDGLLASIVEPNGRAITLGYIDGLLTSIADPNDNQTLLFYDTANSNLTQIMGPEGCLLTYAYATPSNSLITSRTDGLSHTYNYHYDSDQRLIQVDDPETNPNSIYYSYDTVPEHLDVSSSTTSLQRTTLLDARGKTWEYRFDSAGNVIKRIDRNLDVTKYRYDALKRVTYTQRNPTTGFSSTDSWLQRNQYDEVGNRVEFDSGLVGGRYNSSSQYGTAAYANPSLVWKLPANGLDDMNRMKKYQDRSGNQTAIDYDVEGRRSAITYPNGSPQVRTTAAYDIVGRLLSLTTTGNDNSLLPIAYDYDRATNRIGFTDGADTFCYALDGTGQLIEEEINRFVDHTQDRFELGTPDLAEITADGVVLVALSDSFSGPDFHADRWRLAYASGDYVGLEVRQNEGLQFAFPRGFSNLVYDALPPSYVAYGLDSNLVWAGAEHRVQLSGNFDVQVDFADFQGIVSGNGYTSSGLMVHDEPLEQAMAGFGSSVELRRDNASQYRWVVVDGSSGAADLTSSTSDVTGTIRLTRVGNAISTYVNGGSTALQSYTFTTLGNDLYVSLVYQNQNTIGCTTFSNLTRNGSNESYPIAGSYQSRVFDAKRSVTWNVLSWTADTPGISTVSFQVFVGSSPSGPWMASTVMSTPGAILDDNSISLTGQYTYYEASLTGDGAVTPTLSDVQLSFDGGNTSTLITYTYDAGGNLVSRATLTDSGTSTDRRDDASWNTSDRINTLNQILRQDVTPAGGSTVSYTYSFDDNGNLITKADGTSTWHYYWDSDNNGNQLDGDNRLVMVKKTTGGSIPIFMQAQATRPSAC